MENQDLNKLLGEFNALDESSISTRDYILSLEQTKSGIKSLIKKQKKDISKLDQDTKKKKKDEALKQTKFKSGVNNLKKKRKETTNNLQKLQDEFGIQTKTLSKKPNKPISSTFKSGLEEDSTSKDYKFDDEFLISVSGELNKDVLFDILVDSWNFWKKKNKIDEKTLKEIEEGKETSDDSMLKTLLYGFVGRGLWKLLGGFKGFMKKIKRLPKSLMNTFKKGLKSLLSTFDKYVWKPIAKVFSDLFNGVKNFIKGGIKKIADFIDDSLKAGKSLFTKAKNLVNKGLSIAKKGLSKVKNSIANGIKNLGKSLSKNFSKASNWLKNAVKTAPNKIKSWLDKLSKRKTAKSPAIRKSSTATKPKLTKPKKPKVSSRKSTKIKKINETLDKKTTKKAKSIKKAIKPSPKELNRIKKITKTITKQKSSILKSVGKGFGKVGKFLIKKFPPLDLIFEGAFMAHDVDQIAKEDGISTEDAIMKYYQNRRDNFTWVDAALNLLNPVSAGIDAALQLGVDKMAANATDKVLNKIGFSTEDALERSKKKQEGTSSTWDKIHNWVETAAVYGVDSANKEWNQKDSKVKPLTDEEFTKLRGNKEIEKDLENIRKSPNIPHQTIIETQTQYVPVNMTSFPEDTDNIPYTNGNQTYFLNGM